MLERTEELSTSDSIEVRLTPELPKRNRTRASADSTKQLPKSKSKPVAAQSVDSDEPEEASPPLSSAHIVLPDESESEWNQLVKDWQDTYKPQDALSRNLTLRAASAEWLLKRASKRYNQMEQAVYAGTPDPTQWDAKQISLLEKVLRHRTTAERSFYQARNAVEQLRSSQRRSAETGPVSDPFLSAAKTSESDEPAKPRTPGAIIQCVTVQVINGKTFTLYQPRNEYFQRMIESAREPKPTVKRALYFLHGVPSEYSWVTDNENPEETSHFTIERSCQQTLDDLARELAARSMHVLQVI